MQKQNARKLPPSATRKVVPKKQKNVRVVTAPVARQKVIRSTEPIFRQSTPGCIVVEKTEYIGEVAGNTGPFNVQGIYPINAGSAITFPWLSRLAENFESYRMRSLSFHYETEAPTTAPGYVGLVVDYNPLDPPPTTKVVAMDFEESIRGPIWQSFTHRCDQKNLNKRKTYFCRDAKDINIDPTLFDVGNLFVLVGSLATSPDPIGSTLGELWVTYSCEFMTPELGFGDLNLDGFVGYGDVTNQSTVVEAANNNTTADAVFTTGLCASIQRAASGATPYVVLLNRGPDFDVDIPVKSTDFGPIEDLPATSSPETFYWKDAVNAGSSGTVPKFAGVTLNQNTSYVVQSFINILTGAANISSFDVGLEVSNGTFTTTLLSHINDGSQSATAIWQIDVGNWDSNITVAIPLYSLTLAASTSASLALGVAVRFIRPYFTGIVPLLAGYELKTASRHLHNKYPKLLPKRQVCDTTSGGGSTCPGSEDDSCHRHCPSQCSNCGK